MEGKFTLLLIVLLMSLNGFTQDADSTKFEAGAALNRYVPDRDNENLPYFFSGSIRYNFKKTAKYDHLINVRVSGNYNKQVSFKPLLSKRYLSFEAGYQGRWKRDSTNWRFSWGVNAGVFHINERVTPINFFPFLGPAEDPYNRARYKLAISPQISVEYYLNSLTYVQVALSMSVGTPYYGEVDHLEFNSVRGFSAKAPSLGIFRKF
ncbi:hypothetical protein N9Y60_03225 [Crocinitomicaceae bacterium]|nr:hypothetical protein [Crocinitomicaceae bacterium]MDB3906479.1 hypothetical protein [Crocinitomicaceae bacterium]